jgi:putative ABC transport system permease protein
MRANKVRTGLTVLGMVIGIATVIIVFSAGEGIKGLVLGQIESFGTDIIETEIKVPSTKKGAAAETQSATAIVQGVQVTTLNLDDMAAVDKLPNVSQSYAGIYGQEQVSYGSEQEKVILFGASANFIDIDKTGILSGRFYTDAEEKSLDQVAVLGFKMKEKLFGSSDAVGEYIKIRKSKYRVIGVMNEKGAVFGVDFDNYIYVPLETLQKRLLGVDYAMFMIHQIKDLSIAEETADEIKHIMRENHDIAEPDDSADTGKDDFRVTIMAEAMEILGTVTNAITILLLAIVAISLVVGGVGIMNIMYVIVSERTKEIGLRKAVGARYAEILKQFLFESIMITILGGIIGITIGVIFSYLISVGANYSGLDWKFAIPIKSFVVALGFSLLFGVVFGVYPARKAAKMDPIEALRVE